MGESKIYVTWALTIAAAVITASCYEATNGSDVGAIGSKLLTVTDCPAGTNIIEGTDGDDRLRGTKGDDCILGYDGNDIIRGREGDDYLVGGLGEDVIYGNDGDDIIYGEDQADEISGGDGNDTIFGGDGDDYLYGDEDEDHIEGGAGADLIRGGLGNDALYGDDGNDDIGGNEDEDIVYGGDGDDSLNGGDGDDAVYGEAGDDTIADSPGEDTIVDNVGSAVFEVDINSWPVINTIIPTPTHLNSNDTTSLTVDVSDPDGDTLIYFWTADCVGIFSDVEALEPDFTLGAVDDDVCTLTVEVSDGMGGQTTGSVTITLGVAITWALSRTLVDAN